MTQSVPRLPIVRALRGCSLPLLLSLVGFSGCTDEVGGDGWVPPQPSAMGGSAGSASGGDGDGGDDTPMTGGKGNGGMGGKGGSSGGKGGRGGSGGRAGSGMTDGGEGGEPPSGAVCGNGVKEAGEECDDGNKKSGDGCTSNCLSACEECEKTHCKAVFDQPDFAVGDFYDSCYEMPGNAATGKAAGVPRKELCRAVVDCVRTNECAQFVPDDQQPPDAGRYQFLRCFCDRDIKDKYINSCAKAPTSPDPKPEDGTFIPGPCERQFMEASEADALGMAYGGIMTAKLKPLGGANLLLLNCDRKLCFEECFPKESAGTVAQITADILATRNEAGESALGALVADAQRASLGTDFAFLSFATIEPEFFAHPERGWLYAATEGRAADADGRVLESEVRTALFGVEYRGNGTNTGGGLDLVSLQLTGQDIYDFLEKQLGLIDVSGLTFTWDASIASPSAKITEVRVGTTAIDKAATYSVTVNDQLLTQVTAAKNVMKSGKNPAAELLTYLKAQTQPIAPPAPRITRIN